MSYDASRIGPAFFVRWRESVSADDCAEIVDRLRTEANDAGHKLIYVSSVPKELEVPDGPARRALSEGTEAAADLCSSIHVVIEGRGMRRALIRSVSAGLLLVTGRRGKGFFIHETARDALTEAVATAVSGYEVEALLRQAAEAGLVENELDQSMPA